MKFPLGQIVATPGAIEVILPAVKRLYADNISEGAKLIHRHASGDWGEVCAEDAALNDEALLQGNRLLSAYTTQSGVKVWIITEADRSVTTILLPEEY